MFSGSGVAFLIYARRKSETCPFFQDFHVEMAVFWKRLLETKRDLVGQTVGVRPERRRDYFAPMSAVDAIR
jgi:hypothetical protein